VPDSQSLVTRSGILKDFPTALLSTSSASVCYSYALFKMDFNDLKNTVSNLTLYDLKAGFRKAQNGTRRPPLVPGAAHGRG
jgi:hypothetical protein